MKVFVTVGSTQFDPLVELLNQSSTIQTLAKLGYRHLTVQFGKGQDRIRRGDRDGMLVESYRFKSSLDDDMAAADLIISHAGAGSIMEALRRRKNLIVVVNEALMDNHQAELAQEMEDFETRTCLPNPKRDAIKQIILEEFL